MILSKVVHPAILAIVALTLSQPAQACCSSGQIEQQFPGWKIVSISDLPQEDRELWRTYHSDQLPGQAMVSLDGRHTSCAFAIHRRQGRAWFEQLVLIDQQSDTPKVRVLVPPTEISSPFVVWGVAPGKFTDRESGKVIELRHESIVYEKMESTSSQFFLRNGEIHKILASE